MNKKYILGNSYHSIFLVLPEFNNLISKIFKNLSPLDSDNSNFVFSDDPLIKKCVPNMLNGFRKPSLI